MLNLIDDKETSKIFLKSYKVNQLSAEQIGKYVRNIFKEKELVKKRVWKKVLEIHVTSIDDNPKVENLIYSSTGIE